MKAMIFAAGKGTRLGAITGSMPKALVDVNGKTALRIAVERCKEHGFREIIVNIHHFPELVEEEIAVLRNDGFDISVSDERDQLLETGGGLYKARDFFDSNPFLVYNVDIITNIDLLSLYSYHCSKNDGIATLATRKRSGNRFLLTDNEGILRGWRNRSTGEEILITGNAGQLEETGFSGIHVIEPRIFSFMSDGVYTMIDLYLRIAKENNIYTYLHNSGYWSDIGTPENLEYARKISKLPERPGEEC